MTKEESIRDAQRRARKVATIKAGAVPGDYRKNEADTQSAKKFDLPATPTSIASFYLELARLAPGTAGQHWQSVVFEFSSAEPRDILFENAF